MDTKLWEPLVWAKEHSIWHNKPAWRCDFKGVAQSLESLLPGFQNGGGILWLRFSIILVSGPLYIPEND